MVKSLQNRAFIVPLSGTCNTEVIIAEPDLRADNLNLTTWTSSFVLARQLHQLGVNINDNASIPILELGAGTGLVGLTAATIWKSGLVLTDLPGIVPGLRTNVELNPTAVLATSDKVRCGTLDWKTPDILVLDTNVQLRASEGSKASVILAADTIYDEDHPELLSKAILTWLDRTSDARAILCYPLRVAYLDAIREIWAILDEAGLEADRHGQEQAEEEDWDDECLCEWVVWKWKNC